MRDIRAILLLVVLVCLQVYAAEEPVTVVSELTIKTERLDEFLQWIHSDLENSRSFSGNLQFDVYQNSLENGLVLFIERWESAAAQQDYVAWREQRGDFELMAGYLAAAPKMVNYQQLQM